MGLDSVELVLATEEAFGIAIADSEAEHCRTPRDLVNLLFSKLRSTDSAICQSQRAFYLFRRECMRSFGNSRSSISLQTRVEELIPVEKWNSVRDALQARSWPELVAPARIVALRTNVPGILFLGVFGVLCLYSSIMMIVINIFISGLIANESSKLIKHLTQKHNTLIPEKMTVKDLLFFVATSDEITWTRKLISDRVKQIVIEQLGLSEDQYFEDADFIKDLGMD